MTLPIKNEIDLAQSFDEVIGQAVAESRRFKDTLPEYSLLKSRNALEMLIEFLMTEYQLDIDELSLHDQIELLKRHTDLHLGIWDIAHDIRILANNNVHKSIDFELEEEETTTAEDAQRCYALLVELLCDIHLARGGKGDINTITGKDRETLSLPDQLSRFFLLGQRSEDDVLNIISSLLAHHIETDDDFIIEQIIFIGQHFSTTAEINYIIGMVLFNRFEGLEREEEAIPYLKAAAMGGELRGAIAMATHLSNKGELDKEGFDLLSQAFEAKVESAGPLLASILFRGCQAVPRNPKKAIRILKECLDHETDRLMALITLYMHFGAPFTTNFNLHEAQKYADLIYEENKTLGRKIRKSLARTIETIEEAEREEVESHFSTPAISDKTPRNAPCPCGSGVKYKKCCMNFESTYKPTEPGSAILRN